VTGGICLAAAEVCIGWGALPVEPGVGPAGEFGLAMPMIGAGFGGLGGVIGLIAPPITGGGLAAPPILFFCVLAPPIVLCASAGEMLPAATPSTQASVHPIIALLFMRGLAHLRRRVSLEVVRLVDLAKARVRSNVPKASGSPAFARAGLSRPAIFRLLSEDSRATTGVNGGGFSKIDTSGKSPA
jgi:hypothetical protein